MTMLNNQMGKTIHFWCFDNFETYDMSTLSTLALQRIRNCHGGKQPWLFLLGGYQTYQFYEPEPRPRIGRSLRRFQEKEGLSFSPSEPQKNYQIILKPCRVSKSLVPQKEHPTCHGCGFSNRVGWKLPWMNIWVKKRSTENDASPLNRSQIVGDHIASHCHILRQTSSNIIIVIIIIIISCYITIYVYIIVSIIKHHRADFKKH